MNDLQVVIGFATFNNWVNEFCIKVDRLVADCDLSVPIEVVLLFPISEYDDVINFGIGHIMKICHYLYVEKLGGHEMSVINLDFLEK